MPAARQSSEHGPRSQVASVGDAARRRRLRVYTEWRGPSVRAICAASRLWREGRGQSHLADATHGHPRTMSILPGPGEGRTLQTTDRLAKAATETVSVAVVRDNRVRGRPAGISGGARGTGAVSADGAEVAQQDVEASDTHLAGTSYLLGLGDWSNDPVTLAWLRVGTRLALCREPHAASGACGPQRSVAVRAPDGRLLGRLPPDDALAVGELLESGVPAVARVSALVPAFRRQRVQLAIEVGRETGGPWPSEASEGVSSNPGRLR